MGEKLVIERLLLYTILDKSFSFSWMYDVANSNLHTMNHLLHHMFALYVRRENLSIYSCCCCCCELYITTTSIIMDTIKKAAHNLFLFYLFGMILVEVLFSSFVLRWYPVTYKSFWLGSIFYVHAKKKIRKEICLSAICILLCGSYLWEVIYQN